jgi:hypothetical protein
MTRVIGCTEAFTFKGTKAAGKYTSRGVSISKNGMIIAARGHMHVCHSTVRSVEHNTNIVLGWWREYVSRIEWQEYLHIKGKVWCNL